MWPEYARQIPLYLNLNLEIISFQGSYVMGSGLNMNVFRVRRNARLINVKVILWVRSVNRQQTVNWVSSVIQLVKNVSV